MKHMKNMQDCKVCEKSFSTSPYNVRSGNGKYCSRECFRQTRIGIKFSDETRKKMSLSKTGTKLSESHKQAISESGIGRVTSEEAKVKMSKAHKGRKHDYMADEKHTMWKGDKVKYVGLHMWIARN